MENYKTSFSPDWIHNIAANNVIGLMGVSRYLLKEAIKTLKSKVLSNDDTDVNYSVYFADDIDWRDVISDMYTLPFLSGAKMILVKNIPSLKSRDEEMILSYISSPSETTYLILHFLPLENKKIRSSKLIKRLQSDRTFHRIPVPTTDSIRAWVNGRLKKQKFKMTEEAAGLFIELIDPSWDHIIQEWEKLALYAAEGSTITDVELLDIICGVRAPELDELSEAIFKHRKEDVLNILKHNPVDEKKIIPWLGLMRWHIRILMELKPISSEYQKRAFLKSKKIFSPKKIDYMIKYVRLHGPGDFIHLLNVIMEMDDTIRKKSRYLYKFYFERMLLKMTIMKRR